MSIYAFEKGPSYTAMTAQDAWQSAFDQPYSLGNNLVQQAKGGVLESFGLGTAIRDTFIPKGNTESGIGRMAAAAAPGVGPVYEGFRALVQSQVNDNQPDLSEDDYKKSAWYRPNIPFEPGMTQQRAEALATWDDARRVREHFGQKRPISSFIGNLGGQALDPINYVPVFGNLVKAAAVGNMGRIAGTALVAAGDAAANTALAAIPTMGARGQYGDDVSWQTTVSQIATAALIGGAFGGIGGALGKGLDARAKSQAVDSLGTLKTTQESLIALNEGIDGIIRGEDINLSPNATEPMARVATQLEQNRIPTGPAPDDMLVKDGQIMSDEDMLREAVKDHFAAFIDAERKFNEAGGDMDAPSDVYQAYRDAEEQLIEDFRVVGVPGDSMDNVTSINSAEDIKAAFNRATPEQRANFWLKSNSSDSASPVNGQDLISSDSSLNRTASWVIRDKATGKPVMETFDPSVVEKVNTAKYEAVPIGQYLGEINGQPKQAPVIDTSPARPEPLPEGRAQAEARVAKAETYKQTAETYRVDPETGDFPELADIAQIEKEGRLTEADMAALETAKLGQENGAAYAEALKAVVGCLL